MTLYTPPLTGDIGLLSKLSTLLISLFQNTKSHTAVNTPPEYNDDIFYIIGTAITFCALISFIILQKRKTDTIKLTLENKIKRLTDKNKLIENLVLDIKTPITLILAALELVKEKRSTDAILQDIGTVEKNGFKINQDINDIVSYLKTTDSSKKIRLEEVDINEFLNHQLLKANDLVHSKNITLHLDSNIPNRLLLEIDKAKTDKLISHILTNTINFSFENSKIEFKVSIDENDMLCITFSNFNVNQTAHDQAKVFNLFNPSENSSHIEGIGITLFSAKALVALMQGNITLNSSIEEGAEFNITLPIKKKNGQATENIIPFSPSKNVIKNSHYFNNKVWLASKTNILIAEHVLELNQCYDAFLAPLYNCVYVTNGKSALEKLNRFEFDLIISTTRMPVIDGFELRELLIAQPALKDIPFLLISNEDLTDSTFELLDLDLHHCLTKPFTPSHLLASIQAILHQKG
ncbi:response regulator [Algibacter miyuki]|uniref:Response regulator n=1 Tax=Algibacter miyuki TaxID=1306933 RepID=A0ABV5H0Y2_9FLAO|nr:hybrid sensor histidine kinase/response regulator [Algibacter miyuki]MDN3664381.1 hybrid sensor histidine kinase/response regulator [Algibacter miyuki]